MAVNDNKIMIRIVIKGIVLSLVSLTFFLTAIAVIGLVADEYDTTKADIVDRCNDYYYDKEYGDLYDYLILYDAYDEAYDVYWEIIDGYVNYIECAKWSAVSLDDVPDADKMAALYKEKLQKCIADCKFDKNKRELERFATMLD